MGQELGMDSKSLTYIAEVPPGPPQTSKTESFVTIADDLKPLTIVA